MCSSKCTGIENIEGTGYVLSIVGDEAWQGFFVYLAWDCRFHGDKFGLLRVYPSELRGRMSLYVSARIASMTSFKLVSTV